jgi:ABC-type transport system substrate-binding protein
MSGALLILLGCQNPPNSPYRRAESTQPYYYATFYEQPKTLDPARSYSADEYRIICQIYEPPLQYNYLTRPYALEPLTADSIPHPRRCTTGADSSGVTPPDGSFVCYDIRIKPGIFYQPHPCFAQDALGQYIYRRLSSSDVAAIHDISDFAHTGTRELKASDYIYQLYRLADPRNNSPIAPIMAKYILGFDKLVQSLRAALEQERAERRAMAGSAYNQQADEQEHPIRLEYFRFPFPGAVLKDDYTFQLVLTMSYPQILYWLAMPFFCPIPWEAELFYNQGPLIKKNITLQSYPVGTGAFRMKNYDPNLEIVLIKNEHYHMERYPAAGEAGDQAAGYLEDAGKPLPFLDKIVFKLERESIPRWNKFLQGYYDSSGISSDSFDQAVTFSPEGVMDLTDQFKARNIRLLSSIAPTTYYFAFNMLDPLVGGYSPQRQKLRQAISIAIDMEEQIELFANGRGVPAHGPIPPGIFGYEDGARECNPYVYRRTEAGGRPSRKSIAEAQALLSEAGYPDGRDPSTGKPLVIGFDNAWTGPESQAQLKWLQKQFQKLGLVLEIRTTDYNRFQEKILGGNFQFFSWGWHADYPDPENFLFLLYGPNSKQRFGGENAANYDNPEFNRLFKEMETMENSPARRDLIRRLLALVRRDAPWVWGYHPQELTLYHQWVFNAKPHAIAQNTFKYIRLEPRQRDARQLQWNRPLLWPVAACGIILFALVVPALLKKIRRNRLLPAGTTAPQIRRLS